LKADLIFIAQVFHPDRQATGALLSQLTEKLAERGHGVRVFSGYPSVEFGLASAAQENWRGVQISRGGLRIDGKKNLVNRAMAYFSYSTWLMWTLCVRTPTKAHLIAVTNPPFGPVLVWFCSRFRSWSYDVLLHDVYPDGLIALGRMGARSLAARIWSGGNRCALARARLVLVLGRDMADLCRQRYNVAPDKLRLMPNWSQVDFPVPIAAEDTRLCQRNGWQAKFIVQYSGNMGLWHDLQTIVKAAAILRDHPDIWFLLIGDGRRRAEAEALARQLNLANITWIPFQPMEELADSLSCCHAAIISQRVGLEGIAVPSKIYGIMASGRAVLAQVPDKSETAQVVRECGCGSVVPPGDALALAAAVRMMKNDREATDIMGRKAAEAYVAYYTLGAAVDRFESAVFGNASR
jgi:glycosyltransferase involved in cell wall biosynthesis